MVRAIAFVLVISLTVTGCVSWKRLPDPAAASARGELSHGDVLIVHLNDGRSLNLTFESVAPPFLVGSRARVALADVSYVEVRRGSAGAGIAVVVILFGLVALVLGTASSQCCE